MAEFDAAGRTVGVISVGIQACQGLIRFYRSWKDAPKTVSHMCKSVQSLEETLKVLKATIKDRGVATEAGTRVQNSIDACAASINELQGELIKVQGINGSDIWSKVHGQGRRLLYPFRESTLLKLKEIVDEVRENLSLAVDVLHLRETANSGGQLEHLSTQVNDLLTVTRSKHNDEESRNIIEWLSPLNFLATQNDTLRRRQNGTGEWFFKASQFEAWLAGTDRILWCSGLPGAGKTILASAVIDKLQTQLTSENVGLAFVYCNYKERDSQTLANLTGSLVQQLVQCQSTISDEVRALYTECNSDWSRLTGPSQLIGPSEEKLWRTLYLVIARFSHVYVVVDALDEHKSETRRKFIEQLQHSPANLSLLCMSRYLGDIQEAFAKASHLEIRASDADIARYLEAQILQVPKLVKFCKKAGDLQTSIIDKLVEKAKGMFLLAELHLESLKTKTDVKALRKALDVLPEERDKIYEEALERIRRQPADESRLAMRVLLWLTYSIRPLRVEEIQHAIAVMNFEPNDTILDEEGLPDEAELITVCGGIVVIDDNSRAIRLVHYTTEEYFERHRSEIFPTAQVDILCACIRYLSMEPFKDGPSTTQIDIVNRLANFELLEYASRAWVTYAFGNPDDEIQERALCLLEDSLVLASVIQALNLSSYENGRYKTSGNQRDLHPYRPPGIVVGAGFGITTLADEMQWLGESIVGKGSDRWTALAKAARDGPKAMTRLLLNKGADPAFQIILPLDQR